MSRLPLESRPRFIMSDRHRSAVTNWLILHGRTARQARAKERQEDNREWTLIGAFGEEEALDGYGKKGAINRPPF